MKKLLSALLIFAAITASAQKLGGPPSIEEKLMRTKEILGKELKLNSSQLNTIADVFTIFFKKVDEILKGTPPPPTPNQIKIIEGFEKERDQKVISILNEQQIKGYKEIVLKMRPPPQKH